MRCDPLAGPTVILDAPGSGDTRKFANNSTRYSATVFEGWDAGATVQWTGIPGATLKSQTYYKEFQRNSQGDLDSTPLPYFETQTYTRDVNFFSQEFQLTGGAFADRLKYATGVYYSREAGFEGSRSEVQMPANPPLNATELVNKSLGAYVQGTVALTDQFDVTAGVRRSQDKRHVHSHNYRETARYTEQFFACTIITGATQANCFIDGDIKKSATSYTFSAEYKPTTDINLYATARRGFRSGGFNIATSGGVGLAPFQPEVVKDKEIGAKTEWFDRRLRLNISAFDSDYSGIQKSTVVVFPLWPLPVTHSVET